MVSETWDGERVYFTSSLLANWDKKGKDDEQFLKAYGWDGKTLTPRFTVDFAKEKLGRPHIMRFGQTQFYKNQLYTAEAPARSRAPTRTPGGDPGRGARPLRGVRGAERPTSGTPTPSAASPRPTTRRHPEPTRCRRSPRSATIPCSTRTGARRHSSRSKAIASPSSRSSTPAASRRRDARSARACCSALDRAIAADPALTGRVTLVTVSFDPERDTPARMATVRDRHRPRSDWRFVTTRDDAELTPLLADFDQPVAKLRLEDGSWTGLYRHVLKVFLVDGTNRVRNVYSTEFLHAALVLADLRTLLLEQRPR